MRNIKKRNRILTILLIAALCVTSFSVSFAKDTAASKMAEAKAAAKKAAAATANFEAAEKKMHELQEELETTQANIKKTKKNNQQQPHIPMIPYPSQKGNTPTEFA